MQNSLMLTLLLVALPAATTLATEPESLGRSVRVPLDHDAPDAGSFDLHYELGAPFDLSKPTVFYAQDGQQFRIQQGRVAAVQEKFFGPSFNLVGIPGRIFTAATAAATRDDAGEVDWKKAYHLYQSRQWSGDIDTVRRDLLGAEGKIMLYGRSGGALLAQEYLARYGEHCRRVFLQAPPNPALEAALEAAADTFWQQLGEQDPRLQGQLLAALTALPDQRADIIEALQRQHFFHKANELADERAAFIAALHRGDMAALGARLDAYQVNAINRMMASDQGIAIRVRQYEMFQPVRGHYDLFGDAVHPTPEMQHDTAAPLLALHEAGSIPGWSIDLKALSRFDGEVFILAGARDDAVSPKYQQDLAALFSNSILFFADDDHMMKEMQEAGLYLQMHQTFLQHGGRSDAMKAVLAETGSLRWRPPGEEPGQRQP